MARYHLTLSGTADTRVVTVEREDELEIGSEVLIEGRRWRVEGYEEEPGHLICFPVPWRRPRLA